MNVSAALQVADVFVLELELHRSSGGSTTYGQGDVLPSAGDHIIHRDQHIHSRRRGLCIDQSGGADVQGQRGACTQGPSQEANTNDFDVRLNLVTEDDHIIGRSGIKSSLEGRRNRQIASFADIPALASTGQSGSSHYLIPSANSKKPAEAGREDYRVTAVSSTMQP